MEEVGLVPEAEELEVAVEAPEESVNEPEPASEPAPTLDEMVAALAEPEAAAPESGESASADEQAVAESVGTPEPEAVPEQAADLEPEAEPAPVEIEEPDVVAEPLEAAAEEPLPIARRMWTRAPLWVVMGAFVVLVGTIVYLMWPLAAGAFTTHPLYQLFVIGGAALVLVDLVTGCAIWLSARSRAQEDEKPGLAATLWIRTLSWTAGGVALWWIGVALLDLRHAGIIG